MEKILIDLFDGKINPQAQILPNPDNPEYRETLRRIKVIEARLHEMLSPEGQELLVELSDLYVQLSTYTYKTVFTHGFKLGAQIMGAVYEKDIPYYRKYLSPGDK